VLADEIDLMFNKIFKLDNIQCQVCVVCLAALIELLKQQGMFLKLS